MIYDDKDTSGGAAHTQMETLRSGCCRPVIDSKRVKVSTDLIKESYETM